MEYHELANWMTANAERVMTEERELMRQRSQAEHPHVSMGLLAVRPGAVEYQTQACTLAHDEFDRRLDLYHRWPDTNPEIDQIRVADTEAECLLDNDVITVQPIPDSVRQRGGLLYEIATVHAAKFGGIAFDVPWNGPMITSPRDMPYAELREYTNEVGMRRMQERVSKNAHAPAIDRYYDRASFVEHD